MKFEIQRLCGVLVVMVIFWCLASIISIAIHTDDCNRIGYKEAATDGLDFTTIICISPIKTHRTQTLNK